MLSALPGDLTAKAVLAAVAVWLGSPWLWAGWSLLWASFAGALVALGLLAGDRRDAALLALVGGQGLAGVGTVLAVPDAAPLVMLVMFGALTLTAYATPAGVRPLLVLALASAAAVSLVSLGTWSDVPERSPPWVLLAVLLGHGVVTGLLIARTAQETYTVMRAHGRQLGSVAVRLRAADREGRLDVASELATGTARDLDRLASRVVSLRAAPDPEGAVAAADLAKASLARLRLLSQGLFPDSLHQHGLVAAVRALDGLPGAPTVDLTLVEENGEDLARRRLPSPVEAALYACVTVMARASRGSLTVSLRRRRGYAEMLARGEGVVLDREATMRVRDRVDAVRGDLEVLVDGGGCTLHVAVPLATPVPALPRDPETVSILRRFIASSVLLCAAGLITAGALWVVTGVVAVGLVVGVLVVVMASLLAARAADRRGRTRLALVLLCAETSFAGIVVTAAVPAFAPTAALIVMLPMTLGLPYLPPRVLDAVGAVQTVMVVVVIGLGVADTGVVDGALLPGWVAVSLLPLTVVAVGLLVVVVLGQARAAIAVGDDRLQAGLTDLVDGVIATRRRIERDLHDGAQQHLAGLAIQLAVVARLADRPERARAVLDRVASQIDQARGELARLVDGSFAGTLAEVGLEQALKRSAELVPHPVTVRVSGAEALPDDVALAVYFACNEGLQNAVKHGGPGARIEVHVSAVDGPGGRRVAFRVGDDGVGCEPEVLESGRGVRALVHRVREAGGDLEVTSAPGRGTALTGWVPIRAAAPVAG